MELGKVVLLDGVSVQLPSETKQTVFGQTKVVEGANIVVNAFEVADLVAGAMIHVAAFTADKPVFNWKERYEAKKAFREIAKMIAADKADVDLDYLQQEIVRISGVKCYVLKADDYAYGEFISARLIFAKKMMIAVYCFASNRAVGTAMDKLLSLIEIDEDLQDSYSAE